MTEREPSAAEIEAIPPVNINGHEIIEVGNRRWCLGCDLFVKRRPGWPWQMPAAICPRDTPYARRACGEQVTGPPDDYTDQLKQATHKLFTDT